MDSLTDRDLAVIANALSETLPDPQSDEYDAHEAALDKISDELDQAGVADDDTESADRRAFGITPAMIDAGARELWHAPDAPLRVRQLVANIYQAMRRESPSETGR